MIFGNSYVYSYERSPPLPTPASRPFFGAGRPLLRLRTVSTEKCDQVTEKCDQTTTKCDCATEKCDQTTKKCDGNTEKCENNAKYLSTVVLRLADDLLLATMLA